MAQSEYGPSNKRALVVAAGLALGAWLPAAHGEEKPPFLSTDLSYAAHVTKLRKHVPRGFNIVEQPPFVIIGDEWPKTLQRRATETVKWASDLLRKEFFPRDPVEPVEIWMFKDNESYRENTRLLFNDAPTTPYGYSKPEQRRLVVNISNGQGALLHEIVHPFIRANFPACPAWFNEGLASLFESAREQDGRLRGEPNQRLPGLQQVLRAGKLPALSVMLATTEEEFRGKYEVLYYAQARYLCYYLQERGLLAAFFREFAVNVAQDPTGASTLKKVLGEDALAVFQKKWEAFVLKLKFP